VPFSYVIPPSFYLEDRQAPFATPQSASAYPLAFSLPCGRRVRISSYISRQIVTLLNAVGAF
jgi:hypothetical protein